MDADDLLGMIDFVKQSVEVSLPVEHYIVAICARTREMPEVRLGVSPRGGLALLRAARVAAATAGRPFVTPDDVQAMAVPALAHRVILRPGAGNPGTGPRKTSSCVPCRQSLSPGLCSASYL